MGPKHGENAILPLTIATISETRSVWPLDSDFRIKAGTDE